MKNLVIADLHLHSKYSRAVSQKMDLTEIGFWATKKGIDLVATADWTHPLWFRSLQNELVEKEPGLYSLKNSDVNINQQLRFVLSTEVSNIYSQSGSVHRIHTVILSPNLQTSAKVNQALTQRSVNLKSDGRPIMGLSMIELCELLWSIDQEIFVLPAHIWTPWFSLFGSKSGFDSITECYGRYAEKITAIETGLSSDPIMNWSIPELENRQIVSFSDAHSGQKLGREATIFRKKEAKTFNYFDLIKALKKDKTGNLEVALTIEFFPEEGKYHYSGHRDCQIRLTPDEVSKNKGLCPKCHKSLTIGVMDRVQQFAGRLLVEKELPTKLSKTGAKLVYPPKKNRPPFVSIIPLMELISHNQNTSSISKKVLEKYHYLISNLGSEFDILLFQDLEKLKALKEHTLAQLIAKMRKRQINLEPGYDGIFGKIEVDAANHQQENQAVAPKTLFDS